MREIVQEVAAWIAKGATEIAVATVIGTSGSAPRREGAKLAYLASGGLAGSISGGCVEAAIIEEAAEAIRSGSSKVIHFDTSDDAAWEVGLPCGGSIEVLVEPIDLEAFELARRLLTRNERFVQLTILPRERPSRAEAGTGQPAPGGRLVVAGSGERGGAFPAELLAPALERAAAALAAGGAEGGAAGGRGTYARRASLGAGVELFVEVVLPAPTLVVVGGVHIAVALVEMARILGFKTVVVEPRRSFGSSERFAEVDSLIAEWPEDAFARSPLSRESALVVLTHDPKLDDPAVAAALRSEAFYIGALGSARTQEKRLERLAAQGFGESDLARVHGPVGLDLGGSTPEEIALAILSEIVAIRNGREGSIAQKSLLAARQEAGRPQ